MVWQASVVNVKAIHLLLCLVSIQKKKKKKTLYCFFPYEIEKKIEKKSEFKMIDISSFTHRKTHFAQTGQKQNKTHQNSLGVFPQINPPLSLWKYPPLDVFFIHCVCPTICLSFVALYLSCNRLPCLHHSWSHSPGQSHCKSPLRPLSSSWLSVGLTGCVQSQSVVQLCSQGGRLNWITCIWLCSSVVIRPS